MPNLRHDVQMGAEKGAGKFGDQFLAGISRGSEAVLQIARETRGMRGPMTEFMQRRAIKIGGRQKRTARRKPDEILAAMIEGFAAAFADARAACGNQLLGCGHHIGRRHRLRRRRDVRRQAFALLDIEHGEAFEKRHRIGIVALLFRALAFAARNEAVGVTNRRAALAFAHMPAKAQGLAEGQPFLGGEAVFHHGIPQDQDVYAAVEFARGGAARHSQGDAAVFPRLYPRDAAAFQFRDNAGGDFFVKRHAGRAASQLLTGLAHRCLRLGTPPRKFPGEGVGGEMRPEGPPVEVGRTRQGRSEAEQPERSGGLRPAAAGL